MVYFVTDYYNSFKHKELETSHLIFIIRLKGTDYLLLLHTNSGLFDVEAYIEPTRTSRMSFYFMAESIFRKINNVSSLQFWFIMQDLQVYKQKGTQSNTQFTIDNIQRSVHGHIQGTKAVSV